MPRKPKPPAPGAQPDIEAMIRVDHAGEYGAVRIYEGQLAVLKHRRNAAASVETIQHMADQERKDRIIGCQRQAEQAPGHDIAAYRRCGCARAHHIRMRYSAALRSRQEAPLHAGLIRADQSRHRDEYNSQPCQYVFVLSWDRNQHETGDRGGHMRRALPMTHFTRRQMNEILKAKRAQKKRERARAHQSCNLVITNHDGRNTFRRSRELRYKYR